jgi:hypothetical protein
MASAMLNLLESWLGADIPTLVEDKLAFNKNVHQLGLTAVYPNGGDTAIFLRLESAKSLDLMYNTGKMLTYAHQQKLRLALQRGCHIRVLMSDSGSDFWELENLTTGLCPGGDVRSELRDVERNLEGLINDLKNANPPLKGGSMEIRAYSCVPPCSLLIIDNESIRYTPYLPYMHSGEVPAFDIVRRGSPALFDQYQRAYSRVWERSRPVRKVTFPIDEAGSGAKPPEFPIAIDKWGDGRTTSLAAGGEPRAVFGETICGNLRRTKPLGSPLLHTMDLQKTQA